MRYRGCSLVNHFGSRLSQPATIGMRVVAVSKMLELAIVRPVIRRMATAAAIAPAPDTPKPMRNTCGIGPIRSILSTGTNANTALVPKMNIAAMIGAAIIVDLIIVRAASFVSPASTATYSNPLSAPIAILPNTFKLNSVNAGMATANGW